MSGISSLKLNTNVAIATDNAKVQPKKEETQAKDSANLGKDNVKTSGVQKSPVWEGVKLETKKGALTGAAAGAIGLGGITWGAGKIIEVFNAEKTVFGTFGAKGVLITAGVGLAAGAILGAGSGAVNGAVTGKIVDASKKAADANGTDAKEHTKKTAATIGAIAGAGYGVKSGLELSSHVTNVPAKIAITVGVAGLGAYTGAKSLEAIATKIYDKSQ